MGKQFVIEKYKCKNVGSYFLNLDSMFRNLEVAVLLYQENVVRLLFTCTFMLTKQRRAMLVLEGNKLYEPKFN